MFAKEGAKKVAISDIDPDPAYELVGITDKIVLTKNRDQWIDILNKNGLMFSLIQNMEDDLSTPQAVANGNIVDIKHREFGNIKISGFPIQFSDYSAETRTQAPDIG